MKICIIGLGVIGGSFAKAIKAKTTHTVVGVARSDKTLQMALDAGAVDKAVKTDSLAAELPGCDLIIIALTPDLAIDFVHTFKEHIAQNAVVLDCCGVKRYICDRLEKISEENGFVFLGGHPMAGREKSGFSASTPDLFENAPMILTPRSEKAMEKAKELSSFFHTIGFGRIVLSTPEEHDRIIAYTSQLAHIASNAYIKSPTAKKHSGFSAGSFRDLTRVAYLDEAMWTELFLENRDHLLPELSFLISSLNEYKTALEESNAEKLCALLRDGKEKKIQTSN